jgi:hypothetical protein
MAVIRGPHRNPLFSMASAWIRVVSELIG